MKGRNQDRDDTSVFTSTTEHRLVGLAPDNLLAFLALLGLMRCLEAARPTWRARVRWDVARFPIRPLLTIQQSATQADVAQCAATGCEELGADFDFGHVRLLNWSANEARALMRNALRAGRDGKRRAELLSALASDVATINATVMCTPLCLLFGQGNQFFLERLSQAPKVGASGFASTRLKQVVWSPTQIMACALFAPWRRLDRSPSFRWDPVEDRRYAFRAADPSSAPLLTVSGANSLAAVGLPLITVVPATVRGRVGMQTVGVRRGTQLTQFTWPIWTRSTSLAGIRALLTHPALCNEQLHCAQLSSLGVYELRRTARVRYGKYINFTEAEAVGLYGNCETRR